MLDNYHAMIYFSLDSSLEMKYENCHEMMILKLKKTKKGLIVVQ